MQVENDISIHSYFIETKDSTEKVKNVQTLIENQNSAVIMSGLVSCFFKFVFGVAGACGSFVEVVLQSQVNFRVMQKTRNRT